MVKYIERNSPTNSHGSQKSFFGDFFSFESLKTIIFAIAIAILIRTFIFEPFKIPSGSMKANLFPGDYIYVSKSSYGYGPYSSITPLHFIKKRIFFSEPKRGDIIVLRSPDDNDPKKFYIKRLIGLPGDKVKVVKGVVQINGIPMTQKYVGTYDDIGLNHLGQEVKITLDRLTETTPEGRQYDVLYDPRYNKYDFPNTTDEYVVPEKFYFFMGDNRDHSIDSRFTKDGIGYVNELRLIGRTDFVIWNSNTSIQNLMKRKDARFFVSTT